MMHALAAAVAAAAVAAPGMPSSVDAVTEPKK